MYQQDHFSVDLGSFQLAKNLTWNSCSFDLDMKILGRCDMDAEKHFLRQQSAVIFLLMILVWISHHQCQGACFLFFPLPPKKMYGMKWLWLPQLFNAHSTDWKELDSCCRKNQRICAAICFVLKMVVKSTISSTMFLRWMNTYVGFSSLTNSFICLYKLMQCKNSMGISFQRFISISFNFQVGVVGHSICFFFKIESRLRGIRGHPFTAEVYLRLLEMLVRNLLSQMWFQSEGLSFHWILPKASA